MNPFRSLTVNENLIYVLFFIGSPESNSTPKDFPDSPVSSVVDSVLNFMKMFRSILYPLRHEMLLTECGLPMFVKLDLVGTWKIETNFRLESSQHPSQALKPKDIVLDFKPRYCNKTPLEKKLVVQNLHA